VYQKEQKNMNNRKKAILLLTQICFAGLAQGQLSTILVTVTDTIKVPATHIEVMVNYRDTSTINPYDVQVYEDREPTDEGNFNTEAPKPPDFEVPHKELLAILKANNVAYKKSIDPSAGLMGMGSMGVGAKKTIDTAEQNRKITLDFKSKAQFDLVMPLIKNITYLETVEMGASVDKAQVDKKALYAKLHKQARLKANEIAGLAGKTVGEVHQIGNAYEMMSPEKQMENMFGGGGIMGGLMKMMGGMFSEKDSDYMVTITESLTVTFLMR
jgi:hypothetical protein